MISLLRPIALTAAMCALLASGVEGQMQRPSPQGRSVVITPYYGYQFGGEANVREGRAELSSSDAFGATLDVGVRPGAYVTLLYSRQNSELTLRRPGGVLERLFDVAVSHYQIGGTLERRTRSAARPYGFMTLGAVQYAPQEVLRDDEWEFGFVLGGGVKVALAEQLALRGEFRLPITVLYWGSSWFCGTGGCAVGLDTAGFAQGTFSAGLSYAIGR